MVKEIFIYKKVKVFFRNLKYRNLDKENNICPLCRNKIVKGDDLCLIMNNYILFPNMFVHKKCITTKEECIKKLVKEHEKFKKFVNKYKFWIDKYYEHF